MSYHNNAFHWCRTASSGPEANGVVQGIESMDSTYLVGIKWHPEYLPQHSTQRRLFQALVHQASQVNKQIEATDMQQALEQPKARALKEMETQEDQLRNTA
ncbi:hypothetical protein ACXYMU_08505 [Pontibacter sp. CAU 1760]